MVDDPARATTGVVDLVAIAASSPAIQPAWSLLGDDLSVNLVVFDAGDGVEEHTNDEVDVLLVGVAGAGTVTIDDARHALAAGAAVMIPKGAPRSTRAGDARFAYLTCHRRRAGLWPTTTR